MVVDRMVLEVLLGLVEAAQVLALILLAVQALLTPEEAVVVVVFLALQAVMAAQAAPALSS